VATVHIPLPAISYFLLPRYPCLSPCCVLCKDTKVALIIALAGYIEQPSHYSKIFVEPIAFVVASYTPDCVLPSVLACHMTLVYNCCSSEEYPGLESNIPNGQGIVYIGTLSAIIKDIWPIARVD